MMDILSEDDQEGLCFYSKTEAVIGWSEELKLLNRYPWPRLFPLYVHSKFKNLVMVALKDSPAKYQEHIEYVYWENVCNGKHAFGMDRI